MKIRTHLPLVAQSPAGLIEICVTRIQRQFIVTCCLTIKGAQICNISSVLYLLHTSVILKQIKMFWSGYIIILSYGHKLWVLP